MTTKLEAKGVYRGLSATKDLIGVKRVLKDYLDHWPLTVRQIFYRLVGTHGFPKTEQDYGRLCHHLGNARRGRVISFDAIRDDGVTTIHFGHFDDEDHFKRHVRELGENYTRNKLASQPFHIEVWCEAGGMVPQLTRVTEEFSVKVYSCGGFDSVTIKKILSERICEIGKPTIILHLGDYDPSGESIYDAIAEDVAAFVAADRPWGTISVEFRRVALTEEQVKEYKLPTAPPKDKDPRTKKWTENKKGGTCQLEAMPPDILAQILRDHLIRLFDLDRLRRDQQVEEIERRKITRAAPK
jgi:hypothetical protein